MRREPDVFHEIVFTCVCVCACQRETIYITLHCSIIIIHTRLTQPLWPSNVLVLVSLLIRYSESECVCVCVCVCECECVCVSVCACVCVSVCACLKLAYPLSPSSRYYLEENQLLCGYTASTNSLTSYKHLLFSTSKLHLISSN